MSYDLPGGAKVFAGQREDPFFGDIGAIFDLVTIRKGTGATGGGKDFFAGYAVHSIALQIPIADLDTSSHVIGVWATTERPSAKVDAKLKARKVKAKKDDDKWVQVSRLGNPLVNEVLIPTELKDKWNSLGPDKEQQFARYYREPILAKLLNQLYPQFGPFQETGRDDLVQVLLTGVPGLNNTGSDLVDELRLNLSTPVTACPTASACSAATSRVGRTAAGSSDDVIDIAERAVGGALIGHPLPLGDGVDGNDVAYMGTFPYAADPSSGFDNVKGQQKP